MSQKDMNPARQKALYDHENRSPLGLKTARHGQLSGRGRKFEGTIICGGLITGAILLGTVTYMWGKIPGEVAIGMIVVGGLATAGLMRIIRNLW